jgi:hypothetical protein
MYPTLTPPVDTARDALRGAFACIGVRASCLCMNLILHSQRSAQPACRCKICDTFVEDELAHLEEHVNTANVTVRPALEPSGGEEGVTTPPASPIETDPPPSSEANEQHMPSSSPPHVLESSGMQPLTAEMTPVKRKRNTKISRGPKPRIQLPPEPLSFTDSPFKQLWRALPPPEVPQVTDMQDEWDNDPPVQGDDSPVNTADREWLPHTLPQLKGVEELSITRDRVGSTGKPVMVWSEMKCKEGIHSGTLCHITHRGSKIRKVLCYDKVHAALRLLW